MRGQGHLGDAVRTSGQLHDAPVGEPFLDDEVGDLLEGRRDVERPAEDTADPAEERTSCLRPGDRFLRGDADGLGNCPGFPRRPLGGDVQRDADHPRHPPVGAGDGTACPADPPDAAVREQHAVLDLMVLAGLERPLHAGADERDIVRMQQRQVRLHGAVERPGAEPEEPLERLVPVDAVGEGVPRPGAHPAYLEGQPVAPGVGRRQRRRVALVHACTRLSSARSGEPSGCPVPATR